MHFAPTAMCVSSVCRLSLLFVRLMAISLGTAVTLPAV